MTQDLGTAVKIIAGSIIAAGGFSALTFNTISYFVTLDVARRQEKWTPEEFQEKCDEHWKGPLVREDIHGFEASFANLFMNILYRPGKYLACKYLSRKGH